MEKNDAKKKKKQKWLKIRLFIYITGAVISLCVLLFPLVSDLIMQFIADSNISKMTASVSQVSEDKKTEFLSQAQKYNLSMSGSSSSGIWDYKNQLFINESGVMSYLEIPKISIKMPIYHGTDQSTLLAGIGHLSSSSLPVGGKNSHCVLSAHSGMSTMRAFDDLHQMETGDKFILWTLSDPYCYEVFETQVVEPWDTKSLEIEKDKDLCTLITCTPYGINTHRLLVHGKRCDYVYEEDNFNAYLNSRTIPLIVGSCIVLLVIGAYLFYKKQKNVKAGNKR